MNIISTIDYIINIITKSLANTRYLMSSWLDYFNKVLNVLS